MKTSIELVSVDGELIDNYYDCPNPFKVGERVFISITNDNPVVLNKEQSIVEYQVEKIQHYIKIRYRTIRGVEEELVTEVTLLEIEKN